MLHRALGAGSPCVEPNGSAVGQQEAIARRRRLSAGELDRMGPSRLHELESVSDEDRLVLASTPTLLLIRGLPGSGKSTIARALKPLGYAHFEADQYFCRDGRYRYDASKIRDAHAWCRQRTRDALQRGRRVVVANTFTRIAEIQPYLSMCDFVRVIEARGRWPNVHGVPAETIERMTARWEPAPVDWSCLHPVP